MENILTLIDVDMLRKCLAGTPLDVGNFNSQQLQRAAVIMAHCCLNGPVGVNKDTTFPDGLKGSIKSLLATPSLSNKSWAVTCGDFAEAIKSQYPGVCKVSQQHIIHGDIWPLHGKIGSSKMSNTK